MEEAPALMAVASLAHATSERSWLDPGIDADHFSHSEHVQKIDETQLTNVQSAAVIQPQTDEQTVSLVTSGISLPSDRDTIETNSRAVVHTVIAGQINAKASLSSHTVNTAALDPGFSAPLTKESFQQKKVAHVTLSKRPSRAAAAAATAEMARQAKQEIGSLEMLIESAFELEDMDVDMEIYHDTSKKRTIEGPGRALKRSREAETKVLQNTLEIGSAGQHLTYGKQQRQAATSKAGLVEPSPVITHIPPLPFTSTSAKLCFKGRNKSKSKQYVKTKTELTHSMKERNSCADRHCEYCKKVTNICVLMHCYACRRVYHAQCFLHAFKPYVDESMPIYGQIEHLQLKASERRGNIFRCASCKAAFLDFYESGGYLWDCDCPTCSQPEKTVFYRQRKLVQMMNVMELAKQRKKKQKDQRKNRSFSASGKPPVSTPSWSNLISRSRRTRGSSTTCDDHVVSSQKSQIPTSGTRGASLDGHVSTKVEPVGGPEESVLSLDDLVGAVQILRDDKNGGWCFPVMCSRSLSLREFGVMKTGKCKWFPKKSSLIQCDCCDKDFSLPEFVHHTDSSLVKNVKAVNGVSMPFLFVEHRNDAQHTLLEHFQAALRNWFDRQSAKTQPCRSYAATQEMLASTGTYAVTMASPSTVTDVLQTRVSRLQALALYKMPKHKSDKSSFVMPSIDSATLDFVAQIVCLSPNDVINMQDGTFADRTVRLKTTTAPGDSFPRKAGWLPFNRKPASAHKITCFCCDQSFSFDDFVRHTGILLSALEKRSCQVLYVVERQDESALVPLKTFLSDLKLITTNGADMFLDELLPPSSSPRPI